MTAVLLVGNPNSGKTTLFNALTNGNQRVGNWPGVTVEKKTGSLRLADKTYTITDLPGLYSLASMQHQASLDTNIASSAILSTPADLIVNVVDASHLERHLFLTSQLLELGIPMIVVLNMTDVADTRGIKIDQTALSEILGCPVVTIQAHRDIGLNHLKQCMEDGGQIPTVLAIDFPAKVQDALTVVKAELTKSACRTTQCKDYIARRILEGDTLLLDDSINLPNNFADIDILAIDARYQAIHSTIKRVQTKKANVSETLTNKIDRLILHRFLALPIFSLVMYSMFFFSMTLGRVFQDCFELLSAGIFVDGVTHVLQQWHAPTWLIVLLANGAGKGISTTLTFIPVMAGMYFSLTILEMSGYMARAAFIVDRLMRFIGLPGKAFVPMIVGFGCNVPAIMATRILESERDRRLTMLITPFMSCSARLAIYAIFVTTFFPVSGHNVVFSLYLFGILIAILTGLLLRNSLFKGDLTPLMIELPVYQWPTWKRLFKDTTARVSTFINRAGRFIVPVCIILGILSGITTNGEWMTDDVHTSSILAWLGQTLTPVFSPMGLTEENWPATVGLITGMLAKEVVIGTLNTLYMQMEGVIHQVNASFDFMGTVHAAISSISTNLYDVISSWTGRGGVLETKQATIKQSGMLSYFSGQIGAYAYLLFVLLYIPCASTMAVIRQEATRRVMWFSIAWSLLVAYCSAVCFYQLMTFSVHPYQSILYLILAGVCTSTFVYTLMTTTRLRGKEHVA